MISLKRTHAADDAFQALVEELNQELWRRYPEEQGNFAPHNHLTDQARVVVLFHQNEPAACGAFRPFDATTAEIKRMFVRESQRGKGFSRQVLQALEQWAAADGFTRARLETGIRQPEAIGLYRSAGYWDIPPYGPYANQELSVCLEKVLT
jgi:GNAT superfamily N-acetyltransferase